MSAEPLGSQRVEIAMAVVHRDGAFLIGLRAEGAPLAGYWEFPGGKVRAGETAEEAAVRECLEETGLEVRITGSYPSTRHDYAHANVALWFFAAAPCKQQKPLPDRFRWVPASELSNYQFPPANARLLERLAEHGACR